MSRPALAAVCCTLLLAGCGSGNISSTWGPYFEVVKKSFEGSFGDKAVSLEQASEIEYASLGYRLNGGPENLVVLATDSNGEQLWTSAAHKVLITEAGRVKRTVGLPRDLAHLAPASGSILPSAAANASIALSADFPDMGIYSAAITCRATNAGPDAIIILGHAIATTRLDEDCSSPQLGWRFRNSYWLDADKFVWRSVQHIHPKGDVLQVEIFRPPG